MKKEKKTKEKNSFMFTKEYEAAIERLRGFGTSDGEILKLYDAIVRYGLYGESNFAMMDKDVWITFMGIKDNIDKSQDRLARESFVKPTIDEIRTFIKERRYGVDADYFYNYYESNGWHVGKSKMKNWQSTIIRWETNKNNNYGRKNTCISGISGNDGIDFSKNDYSKDATAF